MLYEALNLAVLHQVPASARRILDLGCGTGNLAAALRRRGAAEIMGVTFSEDEARLAGERLDMVIVADLDSYEPKPEFGDFDAIICSHVLEHLRDPLRLLRALRPNLSHQGKLIVALPNLLHWKQRWQLLAGRFRYTEGGLMDKTHLRFFDWDTAQDLVVDAGYKLKSAKGEGVFPLPYVRRWIPISIACKIDRYFVRALPGLFAVQFVIVADND